MPPYVAVCGPGEASAELARDAEEVGRRLAEGGAIVVCGGLGGVMEAACRGAREAGGMTVGLLPGTDRRSGNRWLSVALPTGMGELRNGLIVRACDALVAVGGGPGTLSEIALAVKAGRPVIGLRTWELARDGEPAQLLERAPTAEAAAARALASASA